MTNASDPTPHAARRRTEEFHFKKAITREIARDDSLLASDHHFLVHLPDLISVDYCDAATSVMRGLNLQPYEATVGSSEFAPIPKLGPALFEHHAHKGKPLYVRDLETYFKKAEIDRALISSAFQSAGIPDPLHVLHFLAQCIMGAEIEVATEDGREYFSGVVRDIGDGALPHSDDASVDTPFLKVGQTDRQLSILIYLNDFDGGSLNSYERKPSASDKELAYGYKWATVQGLTYTGVAPRKGSVVVFNPRYLHSIQPAAAGQRRLTISTFIGRGLRDGRLVSWS